LENAQSLNNIGGLYLRAGDLESARRSFEESLALLEHFENRYDRATARYSLADAPSIARTIGAAASLAEQTQDADEKVRVEGVLSRLRQKSRPTCG
jgi:Tfp pilus assembly protein PilF